MKTLEIKRLSGYINRREEEGIEKGVEKGRVEGIEIGVEKGRAEEKAESKAEKEEMIRGLVKSGVEISIVASATKLTVEEIKKIINS